MPVGIVTIKNRRSIIVCESQYCDLNQCITSDTYGQWKVFNSS